jgi:hypothetical protein
MHSFLVLCCAVLCCAVLYCEQFIEDAFQSKLSESRQVQQMYDKFRRYRKREEEKLVRRLAAVRQEGSLDELEEKLDERQTQLNTVSREVGQKEKVRGVCCTVLYCVELYWALNSAHSML